jgi:hypothetical protein
MDFSSFTKEVAVDNKEVAVDNKFDLLEMNKEIGESGNSIFPDFFDNLSTNTLDEINKPFDFSNNELNENNNLNNVDDNSNFIDNRVDYSLKNNIESIEKKGGSYGDVYREGEGDKYEVHHIPADSVSYLERNNGPAIKMEKEDHHNTASFGSSKEAQEYRAKQKELIEQGNFEEAVQMDIDDIKEKFGNKYDDAIAEMKDYINQLKTEGKIK